MAIASSAAYAQTASPLGTVVPKAVPNGPVTALALDGDVLYVGGAFDQVNLPTGTFASVDAATGTDVIGRARLTARVVAIAADGAGGWLVATVDGVFGNGRAELAHVSAAGTLDPAWAPPDFGPRSIVTALALEGGRLFAGGHFSTVNGLPRPGLVALDPTTGAVLSWAPTLALSGGFASPIAIALAAAQDDST